MCWLVYADGTFQLKEEVCLLRFCHPLFPHFIRQEQAATRYDTSTVPDFPNNFSKEEQNHCWTKKNDVVG